MRFQRLMLSLEIYSPYVTEIVKQVEIVTHKPNTELAIFEEIRARLNRQSR